MMIQDPCFHPIGNTHYTNNLHNINLSYEMPAASLVVFDAVIVLFYTLLFKRSLFLYFENGWSWSRFLLIPSFAFASVYTDTFYELALKAKQLFVVLILRLVKFVSDI